MGGLEESCQVDMFSSIDDLCVGIFALLLEYCSFGWENVHIYVLFANLPSACHLDSAAVAQRMQRAVDLCAHMCAALTPYLIELGCFLKRI